MSSKPDAVMIVYRPASDETGEARGKIIRLDPMSAGDKGVKYATVSECTFYAHSQGAVYAQQIQALYENGSRKTTAARQYEMKSLSPVRRALLL